MITLLLRAFFFLLLPPMFLIPHLFLTPPPSTPTLGQTEKWDVVASSPLKFDLSTPPLHVHPTLSYPPPPLSSPLSFPFWSLFVGGEAAAGDLLADDNCAEFVGMGCLQFDHWRGKKPAKISILEAATHMLARGIE